MSSASISPELGEQWHPFAFDRMSKAYELSPKKLINNQSRLVFFSDHHRGTGGRDDTFSANAALFQHALSHYYEQGFTYVEVGDGDELWHNGRFEDIRRTYTPIFDLIYRFQDARRLYAIMGNHESPKGLFDPADKGGIPMEQGLVLQHEDTGQTIFAVHGHQVQKGGDKYWWFNRNNGRYVWKHIQSMSIVSRMYHFAEPGAVANWHHRLEKAPIWFSEWVLEKARRLEQLVQQWQIQQQQVVICGHTHMSAFPALGALPYFNAGHCMTPGYITGLEIENGRISLVKWKENGSHYQRDILQQRPLKQIGFQQQGFSFKKNRPTA